MRLIGPNCLGILNTADRGALNATFAPAMPPRGNVGFVSQSGALGPCADRARRAIEPWPLLVRLDRQSRRHHGQRPARVLGGATRAPPSSCCTSSRSAIRAGSRASRAGSAGAKPIVAVKSGRSRGRRPGHFIPHRRAARGLGRDRGRPVRAGRGDPHREPRGAARRGVAARQPAAAARATGRDPHQRRRARDHVRGRLRGARGSRFPPLPERSQDELASSSPPRRRWQSGGHDRDRDRRALPRGDRARSRRGTASTR